MDMIQNKNDIFNSTGRIMLTADKAASYTEYQKIVFNHLNKIEEMILFNAKLGRSSNEIKFIIKEIDGYNKDKQKEIIDECVKSLLEEGYNCDLIKDNRVTSSDGTLYYKLTIDWSHKVNKKLFEITTK